MKISQFFPAFVFLLLCLLFLNGLLQRGDSHNFAPETNRPLPNFTLDMLYPLSPPLTPSSLKGRVSLVHFFATWCGICMKEQPYMQALSKQTGIPIYAIAWRDNVQALQKWQKQTSPYDFVAMDNTGRTGIEFGIQGVPQTFLIDKKGNIRYGYVGKISEEERDNRLIPLISKLQSE